MQYASRSNKSSGQIGGWNAAGGSGSASVGYILGAQTSKCVSTLFAPPAPASRGNRRGPTTAASWNAVAYRRAVPIVEEELHLGVAGVTHSAATPTQRMPPAVSPRR